jgi:hypothetical protein
MHTLANVSILLSEIVRRFAQVVEIHSQQMLNEWIHRWSRNVCPLVLRFREQTITQVDDHNRVDVVQHAVDRLVLAEKKASGSGCGLEIT